MGKSARRIPALGISTVVLPQRHVARRIARKPISFARLVKRATLQFLPRAHVCPPTYVIATYVGHLPR